MSATMLLWVSRPCCLPPTDMEPTRSLRDQLRLNALRALASYDLAQVTRVEKATVGVRHSLTASLRKAMLWDHLDKDVDSGRTIVLAPTDLKVHRNLSLSSVFPSCSNISIKAPTSQFINIHGTEPDNGRSKWRHHRPDMRRSTLAVVWGVADQHPPAKVELYSRQYLGTRELGTVRKAVEHQCTTGAYGPLPWSRIHYSWKKPNRNISAEMLVLSEH